MSDHLTHQQGLNAANRLAGALPRHNVLLHLLGRDDSHSFNGGRPYATVSVSARQAGSPTIDEALELRDRCRAAGWDVELDGYSVDVIGPWKAPA